MIKRLLFFFIAFPVFAQDSLFDRKLETPSIGQVLIQDIKSAQGSGFVQYRSILSPLWVPLISGMQLGERTLIRINDPKSQLTMSFPDGSFLRIIGIASFYLDSIARPMTITNSDNSTTGSYHTKVLILTGRWFYSSNPLTSSTLIVHSDITTSIVENGSGGGYHFGDTGQMILRTGRGRYGWRANAEKSVSNHLSRPIILHPGQMLNMNIFEGFKTKLEVVTEETYIEYGLFSETFKLSSLGSLNYWQQSFVSDNKSPLIAEDINFTGIDSLENLRYTLKDDALFLQIAARKNTNIEKNSEAPKPKAIPLSLLKPLNLADFEVAKVPKQVVNKKTVSKPKPIAAPRTREKVRAEFEEEVETEEVKAEEIDLEAAIANIAPEPAKAKPKKRSNAPRVRVVKKELAPPTKKPRPKKPRPENPAVVEPEEEYEEFNVKDWLHYTNDPAFQYKKFDSTNLESILDGDISRSLFF